MGTETPRKSTLALPGLWTSAPLFNPMVYLGARLILLCISMGYGAVPPHVCPCTQQGLGAEARTKRGTGGFTLA